MVPRSKEENHVSNIEEKVYKISLIFLHHENWVDEWFINVFTPRETEPKASWFNGLTKSLLMLIRKISILGEGKLCRILKKKLMKDLQHGERNTIRN